MLSSWRSKPLSIFSSIFGDVFSLGFRATSSFWLSEPQLASIRRLEPLHLHSAIRAITSFIPAIKAITSSVWHSEPHVRLAFRATASSFRRSESLHHSFWRSEPHLRFGIQNHYLSSIWRSGPHFQFDTRSPHVNLSFDPSPFPSILAFRAIEHTPSGLFETFLFFSFGV